MRRLLAVSLVSGLTVAALSGVASAEPGGDPGTFADDGNTAHAVDGADRLMADPTADILAAPGDQFHRLDVTTAFGLHFVSYSRTHHDLPVVGGDVVVVTDGAGDVRYTQTGQSEVLDLDVRADVTASAAAGTAADDTGGRVTSAPELVVLAWDDPVLAWETVVTGRTDDGLPTLTHVFTDATDGDVITRYDRTRAGTGNTWYNGRGGTVQFGTTSSGGSYVMRDPARPNLSCARQGSSPYTDADDTWGNATGSDLVTACVDAMYAAGQQWDMLADWLDRDGINGNGGGYPLYVGLSAQNAYWNGSSATFGRAPGGQLVPLDVVAHELGHGIFQTTPGGSGGGNETGGLNEGTGDIFGALTEWYDAQPATTGNDAPDYLVGERADFLIRNMPDPGALGDPDCWSTAIPGTEVHAAAGPINHWFYLTAEGTAAGGPGKPGSTTCDGSTLTGIGIEDAGKIWMGALLGKNSGWTYAQARRAALNFAASTPVFATCAEYDAAKAAFDAVSVPGGSDPACTKAGRDFAVSVDPGNGRVDAGDDLTATVATTTVAGAAQSLTLSAATSSSAITASVSPGTVTSGGTATLTVGTTSGTPDGEYTVTVTATGTTGTKTAEFDLTVGTVTGPVVVFSDDFSTDKGWTVNSGGGDTATAGQWQRGDPAQTTYLGTVLQRGDCASESQCLVTGPAAGSDAGGHDVDNGVTTATSPAIALPAGASAELTLSAYLAHLNNSGSTDHLRISVVTGAGTVVLQTFTGAATDRAAAWSDHAYDLSAYAGQTVRIVVTAADAGSASLVEAAVDDVTVTSG
ncbi:Zn-dependent metalloprotease [Stackebrandtia albiflava]|uniref:Zn-dependent metalloprotease n=1 Tax=Stackebrandtia albiflava TaxID=406432 RepID=A0A562VEQ2_9ACTN|nr:M4 family metallopeptidase [Stackebrandtia albiflava]TWJ16338.1 Zn-dependent metalloprotease [Stackebrandtia albiflava]